MKYLKMSPSMGTLLASAMRGQVRSHWMGPSGNEEFAKLLLECFPSFITEEEPLIEAGKLLNFQWVEAPPLLAEKKLWENRYLFHWPHVGGHFCISDKSITWRGFKASPAENCLDTSQLAERVADKINCL